MEYCRGKYLGQWKVKCENGEIVEVYRIVGAGKGDYVKVYRDPFTHKLWAESVNPFRPEYAIFKVDLD